MNHLRKIVALSAVALSALAPAAVQASFTVGNLAVEQLAQNTSSSTISIVELNPYVTNATPVNSIAIPSTGVTALRQTSSASSGRIALSLDHTLLAFTGAQDGTGVSDESTVLLRGVGTVDASGNYALQATYTGVSGNQARSATSLDDKTWYFGDKGGVYTNGLTTPANTANVRTMRSYNGAVYVMSANSPSVVVSTLSADGKTLTGLPGLAVDGNATDFYMVASGVDGVTNDIIYVSDGKTVTKYSLVGASWVSNGSTALGVNADGLCAQFNGTGSFLYVTTGTAGTVVQITDTAGYNTAPTITTNNDQVLYAGAPYVKGIDFAPMPVLATEQLAANATSTTFSIVELNPVLTNSVPVATVAIPATGSSALRQANNGSTGRLALSQDRTLLAFTAAQDGVGVADETTVNLRGVGTIDAGGNYTLQATYTGVGGSTANQTRGATSLDNQTWYIADKGGVYTNNVVTTPVNPTNIRPVRTYAGTIYALSANAGFVVGTLSTDATTLTGLPGLAADSKALDFYMIVSGNNGTNYDVLYVNDGANVSKYSLFAGSWTPNGSAPLGVTADGICAVNLGGSAALYVTTGTGGSVVEAVDTTGWNQTILINTAVNVTLYTGVPYLKGIDFAPVKGAGSGTALTPPTLTPAVNATVDASFAVTFTDNSAWRAAITNVAVNSLTLSPSAYVVSAGQIVFTPAASALLQTSGSKTITIGATGYIPDTVAQAIAAGAVAHLGIFTQPAGPSGDGGTLVVQPAVGVQDQYGNGVSSGTFTFTATIGSGAWNFGAGSGLVQATVNGTASFTNLSAVSVGAVSGASITFTVSGSGLGGLTSTITNSATFNIPAPATSFTRGNLAVFQEDIAANNSTFSMIELTPGTAGQLAPVNTFPISATGPNALRESSAGTTGRLSDSDDKSLLCFAAFEDGSSLTGDETTITNRGVGTLNAAGNFVLQTSYSGLSGNQARSAATLDNTNWFIGDKGGVYTNNQAALNPFIGGSGANVRSIKSFGGTVYGLQQFSSSLTRTVLQIVQPSGLYPEPGFPADSSVLDFYLVQSGQNGSLYDTAYYIDGTNNSSGTIYKYCVSTDPSQVDVNGVEDWIFCGSAVTTNGGDGLCAATNASGGVDLYYTTGSGGTAGNSVIKVTDSSSYMQNMTVGTPQTLYTANAQATLKGIDFAPIGPVSAPIAVSLIASNITAGSAVLDASVNPNGAATAYWFQYGPTASYGSFTATNVLAAGISPVNVTSLLSGLAAGATYHYQIVATNIGGISTGVDTTLTTLPVTPPLLGQSGIAGGMFNLRFTNTTGASFSVLATNDITAPVSTWPVIGHAVESPTGSGNYIFADSSTTNAAQYYRLRTP